MSPAPFVASASLVVASLLWAIHLAFRPGLLAADSGALLGSDLIVLSVVAATGLLIPRGRWARRLAFGLLGCHAALAAASPIDAWWVVAIGVSGLGLITMAGPWLEDWVRRLPSAAGPPTTALLLGLGLPVLPGVLALAAPGGLSVWHWLGAASALVVAWAYARAHVTGLWLARFLPLPLAPAALVSPLPGAILLMVSAGLLTGLAWTAVARLAVVPLVPVRARPVFLPKELVPPGILETSGDDAS